MSTLHKTTGTITGNLTVNCIRRGYQGVGAKIVLVASDNINIQNWIYQYLEPYTNKGYGFVFVEREYQFIEYAMKHDTRMAFIEDMFFGEQKFSKLENIIKNYPRLKLTIFSAACLPDETAARYVCWSNGSFLPLRSNKKEITKYVLSIFDYEQTYPPNLIEAIYKYKQMFEKKPYLTPRELEILRCFSDSKKLKEVAEIFCVSENTIRNHIRNINRKFGISKMYGAIKIAIAKGFIPNKDNLG